MANVDEQKIAEAVRNDDQDKVEKLRQQAADAGQTQQFERAYQKAVQQEQQDRG